MNIKIKNGFCIINLVTWDWVRGIRLFFGMKPKMVNYWKSGGQHIEYWDRDQKYRRTGCVHYFEFCIKHFWFKMELILPKYYRYYLGLNPQRYENM